MFPAQQERSLELPGPSLLQLEENLCEGEANVGEKGAERQRALTERLDLAEPEADRSIPDLFYHTSCDSFGREAGKYTAKSSGSRSCFRVSAEGRTLESDRHGFKSGLLPNYETLGPLPLLEGSFLCYAVGMALLNVARRT